MTGEASEHEYARLQAVITECSKNIASDMLIRKSAERQLEELRRQDSQEAMRDMVMTAAMHLTPGAGVIAVGHVIDATDINAMHRVISFVSRHLGCGK